MAGIKAFVLIKLFLWRKSVLINTSCKVLLITTSKSGHSGLLCDVYYKRMTKLIFFSLNRLIFSASDRLGRNFPTVPNGGKRKNLYWIKLASKWKRAIRKGHTSFLVFHFWYLKLVPIHSALNMYQVSKFFK